MTETKHKVKKLPYLTKEDDSETFRIEFERRLGVVNEEEAAIKAEIHQLKLQLKQMDKEEESLYGDDSKTIPHFKKKRHLKEKLKIQEEHLAKCEIERQKLRKHITSIKGWDMMFKRLNIDISKRQPKPPLDLHPVVDPYHSQEIPKAKLDSLKRGFYYLVAPPNQRVNYAIADHKYDLPKIERLDHEYKSNANYKRVAAKEKVRTKLENDSKRIENLTKSKRNGLLTDRFNSTHSSPILNKQLTVQSDNEADDARPGQSSVQNAAPVRQAAPPVQKPVPAPKPAPIPAPKPAPIPAPKPAPAPVQQPPPPVKQPTPKPAPAREPAPPVKQPTPKPVPVQEPVAKQPSQAPIPPPKPKSLPAGQISPTGDDREF